MLFKQQAMVDLKTLLKEKRRVFRSIAKGESRSPEGAKKTDTEGKVQL